MEESGETGMTGTNRTPESERVEPSSKDETVGTGAKDPETVANKDLSTNELSYLHLEAMEQLVEEVRMLRATIAETGSVTDVSHDSHPPAESEEATTRDGKPVRPKYELDAEEPAERLQEAIPEGHDMRVKAHEGLVWIQTGQDAPGWAFEHYIKDPEQTEYVHEDHDEFSRKPGEWWKNAIIPQDVDEYIEEVL